jgi:hypothetical protein
VGAKQQQRPVTAVLKQQQVKNAVAGTAVERQDVQGGCVCIKPSSPGQRQQQDSTCQQAAVSAQQQQQEQRRGSAFAGATPLTYLLWDPCEHPHASSIAAAAAMRTVGCKLASSAAHFPYR